jgi:hypothetical protein
MPAISEQLIRQEIAFKTADGRKFRFDCQVERNATLLDVFRELEKQGLKIDMKFYQQYGTYLVTEISGKDKEGNSFTLKDIQIYVAGSFVRLQAQDGTGGWGNAELIRIGDFLGKEITVQSDSHLGQDFLSKDLPKIRALEPGNDDVSFLLNRKNGGGAASEPTTEARKEDLDNLRSQTTIPVLVDVSNGDYRVTTVDGQEITDSNFFAFLHKEFALPSFPAAIETDISNQFSKIINNALLEQAKQFDGKTVSFELELKLVATRFDAVERYQLYVGQTGAVTSNQDACFTMEVSPTTPAQAETRLERTVELYARNGFVETKPPEESQLMRLLMNPTERRLWGKLFGLPDEEVSDPKIEEKRQVAKLEIKDVPSPKPVQIAFAPNFVAAEKLKPIKAEATSVIRPVKANVNGVVAPTNPPVVLVPRPTTKTQNPIPIAKEKPTVDQKAEKKTAEKEEKKEKKIEATAPKIKKEWKDKKKATDAIVKPELKPTALQPQKRKEKTANAREAKTDAPKMAKRKEYGTKKTEASATKKPPKAKAPAAKKTPTDKTAKKARTTEEAKRDAMKKTKHERKTARAAEAKAKKETPHSHKGFALGSPFSFTTPKTRNKTAHSPYAKATRKAESEKRGVSIATLAFILGKKRKKLAKRAA